MRRSLAAAVLCVLIVSAVGVGLISEWKGTKRRSAAEATADKRTGAEAAKSSWCREARRERERRLKWLSEATDEQRKVDIKRQVKALSKELENRRLGDYTLDLMALDYIGDYTTDEAVIRSIHRGYWCGTYEPTDGIPKEEMTEKALRARAKAMVEWNSCFPDEP